MNTSPVHGISAYVKANATPAIASEANSGSPSLRQALTSTAMQAMESTLSEDVSVLLRGCISSTVSRAVVQAAYAVVDRCSIQ